MKSVLSSSNLLFWPVLSLLLAGAATAQNRPARLNTDLAAIQQLERIDAESAKANDVATLVNLWTEDGVLLQPMSAPVIGRESIRAMLDQQKQRAAAVQTLSYVEDWKERTIAGGRAFEWGTITATLRLPNGRKITQSVYAGRLMVLGTDRKWRFSRVVITPEAGNGSTTATE